MDYQKRLNELQQDWKNKYVLDGFNGFCYDGLMYKGDIKKTEVNKKWFYYRVSGNEDELWHKAALKILFLNKDVPFNVDQDIREWIFRQNENRITCRHYVNIALWLYGLSHLNNLGKTLSFDVVNDSLKFTKFLDDTPFAYVNCKKESGGSSILNSTLIEHMGKYSEFIVKQLDILKPNIVVCGDRKGNIKNFIHKNYMTDLLEINSWMYYSKSQDVLVVNSYHPSYRRFSRETIYTRMMENYDEFLGRYPDFKEKCKVI